MAQKTGKVIVPTEPASRAMTITGFTFKSYDKKAGVLQFEIKNQDGSPTDLIDATVRLFMYIYQGEEKKEFPIFDNQIITESYMQGVVKYPIPDMLLSYEGKVDVNVYIDFPDGSHTDNLAFTFNIEKSVIDDNVQLNGEYYFKDFQQLLDGVKQEATDAVNAALTNVDSTIEKANQQINEFVQGATQAIDQTVDEVTEQLQATQTKIDTVSQNVTSAQNNLKAVEDKMNQTNQQIGDLGKLKKMYSNSIDFGDYDYSGNKNLLSEPFVASNITGAGDGSFVTQIDDGVRLEKTSDILDIGIAYEIFIGNLLNNTQYIISYDVLLEAGYTGTLSACNIALEGKYGDEHEYIGVFQLNKITTTDVYQNVTSTFTSSVNMEKYEKFKFRVYVADGVSLALKIKNVKIERGSTATPYQPNLLATPYYFSKVALGENIADPTINFPIKTSAYNLYGVNMLEEFEVGQRYTLTMKATKPVSQTFWAYNGENISLERMTPVEGLTDVWTCSFTPLTVDTSSPKLLSIYQAPQDTVGACQIDWLKIEKGDTRTPNISQFKYFGEGLKDSNNPNDYSWDVTPEYTEKGLNNTVSLTEPQSIEGLKNFEDGIQSKGKSVLTSDDNKYEVVTLTVTNGNTGSAKLYREGKTVTIYFFALNGKSSGGNDSTILTIPEGYRPPISFEQLVGSIDRSTLNSAQLSIGADGAIKWRRNSSYGSDYTFAITYTI